MNKTREKIYRPKVTFSNNSLTKIETSNGRNNNNNSIMRPRSSRSVHTTTSSYLSNDDLLSSTSTPPLRDLGRYEGSGGPNQWPFYVPKPIIVKNYYPEELTGDVWPSDDNGTTITPNGVISLRLRDRIRIDISLDQAVRLINLKNCIVLAMNASGSSSALIHPNGRIYQYGSRVEILAHDGQGNNKFAKMWYKGVSFSSSQCALIYLVDSAGTRTTTDSFLDLSYDFTLSVFYDCDLDDGDSPTSTAALLATPGTQLVNEAVSILQSGNYWLTDDYTDNWIINNVRISQTADGLVRVGRNNNKFSLRTSPTNGSASISSPFMHCTGSMGHTRHLFVRRGERRMHYDGTTFIVRNAGHSAGFDERHQLKVY